MSVLENNDCRVSILFHRPSVVLADLVWLCYLQGSWPASAQVGITSVAEQVNLHTPSTVWPRSTSSRDVKSTTSKILLIELSSSGGEKIHVCCGRSTPRWMWKTDETSSQTSVIDWFRGRPERCCPWENIPFHPFNTFHIRFRWTH